MQDVQENNAWVVWREALLRREEARRTAMSENEFGPQETERFDLDTAGITGEDNPETYTVEPKHKPRGSEPIDYRDVDPRF